MDLSVVYGKSKEICDALRLFRDGKLQYSDYAGVPDELTGFNRNIGLFMCNFRSTFIGESNRII